MPKYKRQRTQVDPLAAVDTNQPFRRLRLTEPQWGKISSLSGIPESTEEARKSIEITLGMFRQFQTTDLHRERAAEMRDELHDMAKATKDLHERLSNLMSKRVAYFALICGSNIADDQVSLSDPASQRQETEQDLSHLWNALLRAPKRFLIAAHRIKNEKRGPKAENIRWLVGNLDGIREQFTGKKITRSYKDPVSTEYITYVCKIADASVGRGAILNAMRDRIGRTNLSRSKKAKQRARLNFNRAGGINSATDFRRLHHK
jgi:hypothetical protein